MDRLAEKLSACRVQSPPDEIRHLRAAFDSKPTVARRAFYSLGNYLLALRVRQLMKRQTVILDRYHMIDCTTAAAAGFNAHKARPQWRRQNVAVNLKI